jgi:hypothetical protein
MCALTKSSQHSMDFFHEGCGQSGDEVRDMEQSL